MGILSSVGSLLSLMLPSVHIFLTGKVGDMKNPCIIDGMVSLIPYLIPSEITAYLRC
jgi:hypothetical protein